MSPRANHNITYNDFRDVGVFHHKFGLDNVIFNPIGPREIPADLIDFRVKFMQEELNEFIEGANLGDEAQMADALIDLVYVAIGTAHLMGLPWTQLWAEVQAANMAKERAVRSDQSRRGSTWDVIKPEGWRAPDIKGILKKFGWAG